jgi:hypothetical protein
MKTIEIIKRILIDLVKGTAASLVSFLGLVVGGLVAGLLHLPSASLPAYASMTVLLPLMLITGIMIAIVLGECFQRLKWGFWPRLLSIGICHYLLYYALNLLDGLLFTPLPNMSTGFFADLFPAFFAAVVIAGLWRPKGELLPAAKIIITFFSARRWPEWTWRFLVAWLIYPPIYYLMGRAVLPFVQHYYEDPSLGLGLSMPPSLGVLMGMQVLRGALFLIAVTPILFSWRGSRSWLWLWVGTVIFIQIAGQAILQAYWLPAGLRIPHSLELLADSFVQAGFYAWLLFSLPVGSLAEAAIKGSAAGPEDQELRTVNP